MSDDIFSDVESNASEDSNESSNSEELNLKDTLKEALGDNEEPSEEESDNSDNDLKDEIKELKKKLKLKIDGQEIEEEIDFNDDERLIRALQKEKAFEKRSQELASMKKQIDQFIGALKNNPADVLAQMGMSMDELAEKHIERMIEESKKSPEELAREKMEKELKELKEEKDRLSKEKEDSEMERLRNEHAAQIENDIQSALSSAETVLPKNNPWVLQEVAKTMLFAMQNGYPEVTAKDVIPLVEDQFRSNLKSMFDIFPEDVIEKVVGKNNLDRVRKKRLKNRPVTKTARQVVQNTNSKSSEQDSSSDKKETFKDFFSLID